MPTWSPARYRALADKCRAEAARKPPPAAQPLLALAEEYEAKAEELEAVR